jgi:putative copper export protein
MGVFLILAGLLYALMGSMAMFSNLSRRSYGSTLLMKASFILSFLCLVAGFVYFKVQPYK